MTTDPLSSFGRDVVDEIDKEISRNGSLKPLLGRLGIKSIAGTREQKAAIAGFIYQYGVGLLLDVLRSGLDRQQIDRQRLSVLSASRNVVSRREAAAQSALNQTSGESPSVGIVPPKPGELVSVPIEAPPAAPVIDTPTYKGPDRRMIPDRRSGSSDRRATCELILRRNCRFGGARRTTVRRQEDKAKAGKS